jgi:hypothetical protein
MGGRRKGTQPKNRRPDGIESWVRELVAGLLTNPEPPHSALERLIEIEHEGLRGDPNQSQGVAQKLVEVRRMCAGSKRWQPRG